MTTSPYPKRGWLMSWLLLPLDIRQIRKETPVDAAEVVKYLESLRLTRSRRKPMQILVATLRQRAAESN